MLIKCPECEKEISDKSEYCINCGFPISDFLKSSIQQYIKCKFCEQLTKKDMRYCENCGKQLIKTENNSFLKLGKLKNIYENSDSGNFFGVYKYTVLGDKEEMYCPRCRSSNCSHYKEQKQGSSKSNYSINLNPLRPFTFANKKEKQQKIVIKNKFICNSCGKVFR